MDGNVPRGELFKIVRESHTPVARTIARHRSGPHFSGAYPPQLQGPRLFMTHIEMACHVLASVPSLHVSEIRNAIEARFGVAITLWSLTSCMNKRSIRGDRVRRLGNNRFALLNDPTK